MTIRRWALVLVALAVATALAAAAGLAHAKSSRPNVVVVMTDDQDFRSMWAMPKTRALIGARPTC
jgi:anti-sigma-K factor RskA